MIPEAVVDELSRAVIGETFNFYREGEGAANRRRRLRRYLSDRVRASIVLVGEAAGYRGARVSGVPFTSERQLSGRPPGEATATIVHRVLRELRIENDVLLWNIVPTHPHRPGEPESNRRPTRDEIDSGVGFLPLFTTGRLVIPIGRVAQSVIGGPYVRHPSHGGGALFAVHLVAALRQNAGT